MRILASFLAVSYLQSMALVSAQGSDVMTLNEIKDSELFGLSDAMPYVLPCRASTSFHA